MALGLLFANTAFGLANPQSATATAPQATKIEIKM